MFYLTYEEQAALDRAVARPGNPSRISSGDYFVWSVARRYLFRIQRCDDHDGRLLCWSVYDADPDLLGADCLYSDLTLRGAVKWACMLESA